MYKLLSFIFVFSVSTTVYAKVTDADVDRDMRNLAAQNHFVTQGEIDQQWNQFNQPPRENGEKIDWANMPSGTRCGNFVMSGGQTRALDLCQGHNPRYNCPPGFTRRDFGYFEAGGGPRQYNWCTKN
ncbi:hypothetical protein [Photobacterium damselae]|uniref:hypothetical protein n=1 Tax=Photobacterium damselae TaxID=38293 RepID=UPI0010FE1423|nr:hypothetical protein [Photobacterium damselae]TLS88097.1 hypothetical protein FD720_06170 [Photobacterium damselae subsp. damselae]